MKWFLLFVVLMLAASSFASGLDEFKLLWEFPLIKGADDVQVFDADGDGVSEIYVVSYSSKNTILSSFDVNGSLLWDSGVPRFSFSAYPTEEVKLVRVVDVDGDEFVDLVIGSEAIASSVNYHPLYLAEREPEKGVGVVRIYKKWTYERGGLATSAFVSDFYGNDSLHVVSSSSDFNVYVFSLDGVVSGVFDVGSSVRDAIALNADRDPKNELLVGAFEGIVFLKNGSVKWRYPTEKRVLKVSAYDLNSNGSSEFIGASSVRIYVVSAEGKLIWDSRIDDLTSNLLVTDLEGDGKPEILLGSGGKLTIFDGDGRLIDDIVFEGRVNAVSVIDANGDGVYDVVVGLNNRIIFLELSAHQVKGEIAANYYKKAMDYYAVGEISKAIFELEASISLYAELENTAEVERLMVILGEYKQNLVLEDQIKLAFDYLDNARLFFSAGKDANVTESANKALEIFISLNNSGGVTEANNLLSLVEEHQSASLLLAEAEQFYISGDFEKAMIKAQEALMIFSRLNDSLGIKQANSISSLIEESIDRATTLPETTSLTRVLPRYTTTLKSAQQKKEDKYLIYAGGFMVAVMFLYVVKLSVSSRGRDST